MKPANPILWFHARNEAVAGLAKLTTSYSFAWAMGATEGGKYKPVSLWAVTKKCVTSGRTGRSIAKDAPLLEDGPADGEETVETPTPPPKRRRQGALI